MTEDHPGDDAPGPSAPASFSYRPSLDGLRALAIGMVIAFHLKLLPGGFLGVDLFFVLSGFLITSILLREWEATGTIALPRFYLRRFLRLAPALGLFVFGVWVLTHGVIPSLSGQIKGRWALYALTYVSNVAISLGNEYPLGAVAICWSLALEEQFYLLWPWALRGLFRRRVGPTGMVVVLGVLIAGVFVLRYALLFAGAGDLSRLFLRMYYGPDTRADALLVGCGLGLLARAVPTDRLSPALASGAVAGLGLLAFLAATRRIQDFVSHPFLFLVSALAAALVIVGALVRGPLRGVLEWPGFVWLGQLSYSLYLWHAISVTLLANEGVPRQLILMLALAVASHYLVERPVLGLNRRFGAAPRPHPRFAWPGTTVGTGLPRQPGTPSGLLMGAAGLAVALVLGYVRLTGHPVPGLALEPLVLARDRTQDGEYVRAAEHYRRAGGADAGDGSVFAEIRDGLSRAGDWAGAIAAGQAALERRPSDPMRHLELARALIGAGRRGEGRAAFSRALALRPELFEAHVALGRLALDEERPAEAIPSLERAVALRPMDASVHNELGVAFAMAGQFREAVLSFQRSLALSPTPSVAENLARAERDRRAHEEAASPGRPR